MAIHAYAKHCVVLCLWLAAILAAHSAPAAEASAADTSNSLEEVVVTAEKRSANVQSIPIAISAIGSAQLEQLGASGLGDLQAVVPSMQFSTQSADAVRVQLTIRGIGSDVIEAGADAGVGLYLDGVYMGRTSAALTSIFDLDRVEVLRGPQGTLYGRNTSGGAVNIISKQPTNEFEAYGDVTGGTYDDFSLRGVINGPLSDSVAARLSFGGEHRNGFQRNLYPGGTSADDNKTGFVRLQVLFHSSDVFSFLANAYYDKIGGVGPATKSFGATPPVFATGILPNGVPDLSGVAPGNPSTYALANPFPTDYHTVDKNTRESVEVPLYGVTGTAQWILSQVNVKSITAYQGTTQDQIRDLDGTELPLLVLDRHESSNQITQEFNLSSRDTGSLEWLLGAYYFREHVSDDLSILGQGGYVGFGGPGGGLDQTVIGEVTTRSYAGFGQLSYKIGDKLKLTAGLRYTDDNRQMTSTAGFIDRVNGALLLAGGSTVRPAVDIERSWRPITWKGGVDYQFTDDVLGYVSVSNAFKSGGFNLGNPLARSFDPEKMKAYEVGLKTQFLDHRLKVNLAAFHYDVKDMQLEIFGIGGPEIINATGGKVDGFEIETAAVVTDELRLIANASWLKTHFNNGFAEVDPAQLSFLGPVPPVVNLGGNEFPRSPKYSFLFGPDYRRPFFAGDLTAGAEWNYQAKTYYRFFDDNSPYRFQPGYGLLNLRVGYEWDQGRWTTTLHVRNVADKQYLTNDFVPPILLGSPDVATVGAPRTFVVDIHHRF